MWLDSRPPLPDPDRRENVCVFKAWWAVSTTPPPVYLYYSWRWESLGLSDRKVLQAIFLGGGGG